MQRLNDWLRRYEKNTCFHSERKELRRPQLNVADCLGFLQQVVNAHLRTVVRPGPDRHRSIPAEHSVRRIPVVQGDELRQKLTLLRWVRRQTPEQLRRNGGGWKKTKTDTTGLPATTPQRGAPGVVVGQACEKNRVRGEFHQFDVYLADDGAGFDVKGCTL